MPTHTGCLETKPEEHVTVTELFLFCDVRSLFLLFFYRFICLLVTVVFMCVF